VTENPPRSFEPEVIIISAKQLIPLWLLCDWSTSTPLFFRLSNVVTVFKDQLTVRQSQTPSKRSGRPSSYWITNPRLHNKPTMLHIKAASVMLEVLTEDYIVLYMSVPCGPSAAHSNSDLTVQALEHEKSVPSSINKAEVADPYRVTLDENDSPKQFSSVRKWLIIFTISSAAACVACASSMARNPSL
jgi:hypothetical protein